MENKRQVVLNNQRMNFRRILASAYIFTSVIYRLRKLLSKNISLLKLLETSNFGIGIITSFRRILLSNRKGQSAVEYILLLSVVSSLAFGVYKSNWFKSMFGENSSYFDSIRKKMEYEFRYTQSGKEDTLGMSYMGTHDSYHAAGGGESHYFMPLEKYPNK